MLASASRAVVGLGVQQTHNSDRLPRACVILCLCHSCIPVYTMRKAAPDPDIFRLLLINRSAALSSGARSSGRVCWLYSFTGGRFGWWRELLLLHMHTLPCGYGLILTSAVTTKHAIALCSGASWSGWSGTRARARKKWITNHDAKTGPAETGSTDLCCGLTSLHLWRCYLSACTKHDICV